MSTNMGELMADMERWSAVDELDDGRIIRGDGGMSLYCLKCCGFALERKCNKTSPTFRLWADSIPSIVSAQHSPKRLWAT
jgi:hypothetical protein